MLYAVSEIVFFLLLATLLGIGLGWWMARSDRVSVVAAMDRSGAHAAANRELAEARSEVAHLTAKLAVATEAIRELEHEGTGPASTADNTETMSEADPIEVFPEVPAAPAPPIELHAIEPIVDEPEVEDPVDEAPAELEEPVESPEAVVEDEDLGSDEQILRASKDRGGKRLSTRVAEASVFSRRDRTAPKIKFGED